MEDFRVSHKEIVPLSRRDGNDMLFITSSFTI